MQTLATALFIASASAIALQDPKYDHIYANVERDHYVKADEVVDFQDTALIEIDSHNVVGEGETQATNDAIQSLLDFFDELQTDDHFGDLSDEF